MKRTLFATGVLMLLLPALELTAQPDFSDDPYFTNSVILEIGSSVGVMNCLTDLGGSKGTAKKFISDVNWSNSKACGSIYMNLAWRNALVLRTDLTWGGVRASDHVLGKVKESTLGRYDRNLSFRSSIFEVVVAGEVHPRYFKKYTEKQRLPRFSPYVMGGVGFFTFNPQAKSDGVWIDLQPLSTEGQGFAEHPDRKPYKLKQFCFPVGGGFRYKLSSMLNFSAECVYRILTTDYLDDVSTSYIDKSLFAKYFNGEVLARAETLYDRQKEINPSHTTNVNDIRGNPKSNDSFFSINFKVGFIF
jgi:hypothetical protein